MNLLEYSIIAILVLRKLLTFILWFCQAFSCNFKATKLTNRLSFLVLLELNRFVRIERPFLNFTFKVANWSSD